MPLRLPATAAAADDAEEAAVAAPAASATAENTRLRHAPGTHILDRLLALHEHATGVLPRPAIPPLPVPSEPSCTAHPHLPGEAPPPLGLAPQAGRTGYTISHHPLSPL